MLEDRPPRSWASNYIEVNIYKLLVPLTASPQPVHLVTPFFLQERNIVNVHVAIDYLHLLYFMGTKLRLNTHWKNNWNSSREWSSNDLISFQFFLKFYLGRTPYRYESQQNGPDLEWTLHILLSFRETRDEAWIEGSGENRIFLYLLLYYCVWYYH